MSILGKIFGPTIDQAAQGMARSMGQYVGQDPTSERPIGAFDPNNMLAREADLANQWVRVKRARKGLGLEAAGGMINVVRSHAFLIGGGVGVGVGLYIMYKIMKKSS